MNSGGLNWPSRIPRLLWMRRRCPLCTSIEFRQAESGALDGLLGLLTLRAVRCANCWRRYYWFARKNKEGR
jgi:hypothetical protein